MDSLRDLLVNFYLEHNPSKVGSVDGILQQYKGQESMLMSKLLNKYGKDPLTHVPTPRPKRPKKISGPRSEVAESEVTTLLTLDEQITANISGTPSEDCMAGVLQVCGKIIHWATARRVTRLLQDGNFALIMSLNLDSLNLRELPDLRGLGHLSNLR
jgi:hypothetical protein